MATSRERVEAFLRDRGFNPLAVVLVDPSSRAIIECMDRSTDAAASQAMAGFDWSDQAQAAWASERLRVTALQLLGANSALEVAIRVVTRDLYTQLNDVRELLGMPRILEPEILGRLVPALFAGQGEI